MFDVGFTNILKRKKCIIDGEVNVYYEVVDCDLGFIIDLNSKGLCFMSLSSNEFKVFPVTFNENAEFTIVNFKNIKTLYNENKGHFNMNDFLSKYRKNIGECYVYNYSDERYYEIKDDKLLKFIEKNKKNSNEISNDSSVKNSIPESLLRYGEVLTDKIYYCNPAISRDNEIEQLELALITPKKSPLIIGEPGVGKTSIVEGLAYRIQRGDVPDVIKNKTIFKIEAASLISGCKYVGMVEENVQELLKGIVGKENIILFIDEFHTLIGLGTGSKSNIDVANMLKPYLASGEIKIIGATTKDEYNSIILQDKAFDRRFKTIEVLEPKLQNVIKILNGSITCYEHLTNIKFDFEDEYRQIIFECLANLTGKINRVQNKNYPDITLEILAESFAFAALNSRKKVLIDDIIKSIENSSTVCREAKNDAIEYISSINNQKQKTI